MAVTLSSLKNRIETDLPDSTLTTILNAETEAVERDAGALNDTETHIASGTKKIVLHRKPATITSITERRTLDSTVVTLASDDWRQIGDRIIYRIGTGTNPAADWGTEVVVGFTADIDSNLRDRVTLDLIQLSIEFRAFEIETDGDWKGDQSKYSERREQLLGQIRESRSVLY